MNTNNKSYIVEGFMFILGIFILGIVILGIITASSITADFIKKYTSVGFIYRDKYMVTKVDGNSFAEEVCYVVPTVISKDVSTDNQGNTKYILTCSVYSKYYDSYKDFETYIKDYLQDNVELLGIYGKGTDFYKIALSVDEMMYYFTDVDKVLAEDILKYKRIKVDVLE